MARLGPTTRRRYVLIALVAAAVAAGGILIVITVASDGSDPTAGGPSPAGTGTAVAPPVGPSTARGCGSRPDDSNTGPPEGTHLGRTADVTLRTAGQLLVNKEFFGLVDIYADNVTIRNSVVHGGIRIRGNNAMIDHVAAIGVAIRGGSGHVIQYADVSGGDDGFHIDSKYQPVSRVLIRNNYVHNPSPPPDAHVDGVQVRGVRNLILLCNNFDLAPYQRTQNGVIYLEWASGGNYDVIVDRNWLNGGGSTLFVAATNLRVTQNRFGRDFRWSVCRLGDNERSFFSAGNVWDDTGTPVKLCDQE